MKEKVPEIEGYNAQQREQIAEFVANYEKGLSVAQASLDEKEQDLTKSYSKLRYADIVAPIDGTIQQISVTTIGQVVSPGQQLMTIVPLGGKLEIEALLENKDIGFVKPGQDAVVKVDAFPFSRYGTIAGAVARISRDSVGSVEAVSSTDTQQKVVEAKESAAAPVPSTHNLVYPVIITLKSDTINVENKPTPLSAGMTAVVEIRTGSRSVLEYLFSPFIEAKSQAFHER